MRIRAKFRVHDVMSFADGELVCLDVAYAPEPDGESYSWAQGRAGEQLSMFISNPAARGALELNKEYFIEFTPAE